jgi:hypothetical protein
MRPVGETEFVAGVAAMGASGNYGPTRVAARFTALFANFDRMKTFFGATKLRDSEAFERLEYANGSLACGSNGRNPAIPGQAVAVCSQNGFCAAHRDRNSGCSEHPACNQNSDCIRDRHGLAIFR